MHMRKWITLQLGCELLLALATLYAAATASAADVQDTAVSSSAVIIDTHAHLIRNRRGDPPSTASRALRAMDEFKVEKTILLPPPFSPNHKGTYGRRELEPVIRDHPGRFAFVAGGESLNPMIHDVAPENVTREHVQRFQKEAALIVASGAVGFGELTAEHFSSGRGGHPYESTRPDHPLFLALADIAAQNAMPIDLHMEAVPQDMEMPDRMRKGANPERLKENISGFERLLAHNRKARIVWAHAGWDLTGERTVPLMRSLLEEHPNLYMSIKLDPRGPQRTSPFTPDGVLRPDWVALLRAFPDRFMIGSDQFFDEGTERLARARRLIDALPSDTARLVASENAKRIYGLDAKPRLRQGICWVQCRPTRRSRGRAKSGTPLSFNVVETSGNRLTLTANSPRRILNVYPREVLCRRRFRSGAIVSGCEFRGRLPPKRRWRPDLRLISRSRTAASWSVRFARVSTP